MKTLMSPRKFFPKSLGSIFLAVLGYVVVLFGYYLVVVYVRAVMTPCNDEFAAASGFVMIAALCQLAVSTGTLFAVLGLRSHSKFIYESFVAFLILSVFIAQALVGMGIGFGVGTACST